MIARRGFLAALGMAPVLAQGAGQSAASLGSLGVPINSEGCAPVRDPLADAAHNYLRKIERAEERKLHMRHNMPLHIRGKKSWSKAFKAHVAEEEYRQSVDAAMIYTMEPAELIAFAVKRGWGGLPK